MKESGIAWEAIEAKLQKDLTENRYRHTLGVTYTACALTMAHGEDMEAARLAGLLHDCAKCISHKEKLEMCKKSKLEMTEFEQTHPVLLHAILGAHLARKRYGVKDENVLSAIRWHTTGRPAMSRLEQIIYIADYIEPNRDKAPRLPDIREAAFADLEYCMYLILTDTVQYLENKPDAMDRTTVRAYEYYRELAEEKEEEKE